MATAKQIDMVAEYIVANVDLPMKAKDGSDKAILDVSAFALGVHPIVLEAHISDAKKRLADRAKI